MVIPEQLEVQLPSGRVWRNKGVNPQQCVDAGVGLFDDEGEKLPSIKITTVRGHICWVFPDEESRDSKLRELIDREPSLGLIT